MTAMLNIRDLKAYYGQVQALHGLEFGLSEGSLTTLLGANGAGKTTTLRAICNMVRSTGSIEFDGAPLTGRSTESIVRLGIAHVPQGRGTFTTLTVEENLQLGAITRKDKAGVVVRHRAHVRPLPGAQGAAHPAGRHAVRRRTADARGGPRLDAASAADAAGRAVVRPGAADRARPVQDPRQDQPRRQGHHSAWWSRTRSWRWSSPTRPM